MCQRTMWQRPMTRAEHPSHIHTRSAAAVTVSMVPLMMLLQSSAKSISPRSATTRLCTYAQTSAVTWFMYPASSGCVSCPLMAVGAHGATGVFAVVVTQAALVSAHVHVPVHDRSMVANRAQGSMVGLRARKSRAAMGGGQRGQCARRCVAAKARGFANAPTQHRKVAAQIARGSRWSIVTPCRARPVNHASTLVAFMQVV